MSAVLLGLIWPGVVQQFQVKPSEADKEEPYIAANIKATRAAYDLTDVNVQPYTSDVSVSTGQLGALASQTSSTPLVDPKLVRQTFEQNQQARAYYSVAPVLDVDRYTIQGIDRALVLGVRELDQSGRRPRRPELVEPAHRVHARQRDDRGVRQPAPGGQPGRGDEHPLGRGPADRGRAAGTERARRLRVTGLLRRAEPGLLRGGQGAGGLRRRARPGDVDLGGRRPGGPAHDVRRDRRCARGQPVEPAHVRREVQRAQLPALRAGEREQLGALQPQPAPAGREGGARG